MSIASCLVTWRFLGIALVSMTLPPGYASESVACDRSHAPKPDLPERGISAHRGGVLGCPENTVGAFQRAICRGVHQIELDVRATADEALVVAHNDQVTDEDGQTLHISTSTIAEVRRLRLESCAGEEAWQRIPTLDEALAVMPQNLWINLDIKENDPLIGRLVAEAVGKARRFDQVIFGARDETGPAVRRVAQKAGSGSWIANMSREMFRFQYVDTTIASCDEFIQLASIPYLPFLRGNPNQDTMDRLKEAGVRVNYSWLRQEKESELRRELGDLYNRGLDFVLVDHVDQAMNAADTLGIPPLVPSWNPTSLQAYEPLFHCPSIK